MYLIEPYNAYQQPARKKHWTEIAEEEALYVKMVMEHQAAMQSMTSNNGTAVAAVGVGGSSGEIPFLEASFTFTTSSATAPSIAYFTNTTTQTSKHIGSFNFLWTFGSGSLTNSSQDSVIIINYLTPGTYTASLQATASAYNLTSVATASWTIAASEQIVYPIITDNSYNILSSGDTLTGFQIMGNGDNVNTVTIDNPSGSPMTINMTINNGNTLYSDLNITLLTVPFVLGAQQVISILARRVSGGVISIYLNGSETPFFLLNI